MAMTGLRQEPQARAAGSLAPRSTGRGVKVRRVIALAALALCLAFGLALLLGYVRFASAIASHEPVAVPRTDAIVVVTGGSQRVGDAIGLLGAERGARLKELVPEARVANLWAVHDAGVPGPTLVFAGHTDVVPVGDEAAWKHPPFAAEIVDGVMYGRGAVDMKGGIACFVAALARHIEAHGAPAGSISLLITGDEEGPGINGTVKLLEWAHGKGERWDACLVGEPTNPNQLGDMIKIGRRGSVSGTVTVRGVQGHAAYPHLADNPVRGALRFAESLMTPAFDEGSDNFQPSNLEVTTIDVGNPATNVIPASASFKFNIRFNDRWTAETVQAEILRRLDAAATDESLRPGRGPMTYEMAWSERPSHVFLTRSNSLIASLSSSIETVTGRREVVPPDLGGKATTQQVTEAVIGAVRGENL